MSACRAHEHFGSGAFLAFGVLPSAGLFPAVRTPRRVFFPAALGWVSGFLRGASSTHQSISELRRLIGQNTYPCYSVETLASNSFPRLSRPSKVEEPRFALARLYPPALPVPMTDASPPGLAERLTALEAVRALLRMARTPLVCCSRLHNPTLDK